MDNKIGYIAGILIQLILSINAYAFEPEWPTLQFNVDFSKGSSLIGVDEIKRIGELVESMRSRQWCTLQVGLVIGYANISEADNLSAAKLFGSSEAAKHSAAELAESRATAVRQLLMQYGVPLQIINLGKGQVIGNPNSFQNNGPAAIVHFIGSPPKSPCHGILTEGGFWIDEIHLRGK